VIAYVVLLIAALWPARAQTVLKSADFQLYVDAFNRQFP
jgi:hypothetical protein